MRIYSSITIDMSTGHVVDSTFSEYEGPVALCKNDQAKQDAHNAAVQSQSIASQQMTFNNQLMGLFSKQFANQQGVLDFLKGKMTANINKPQGMSPEALAAARTQATDTTALKFQAAQRALQNNPAMGSAGLPSGVRAQNEAALQAEEAGAQANAQENITAQNENLKNANYWNSVNSLNGVSAQINPLGYSGASNEGTGAATGAVNATSNAVNAETNAYNAGNAWMGALGGIAGGAGTALGGYLGRNRG